MPWPRYRSTPSCNSATSTQTLLLPASTTVIRLSCFAFIAAPPAWKRARAPAPPSAWLPWQASSSWPTHSSKRPHSASSQPPLLEPPVSTPLPCQKERYLHSARAHPAASPAPPAAHTACRPMPASDTAFATPPGDSRTGDTAPETSPRQSEQGCPLPQILRLE